MHIVLGATTSLKLPWHVFLQSLGAGSLCTRNHHHSDLDLRDGGSYLNQNSIVERVDGKNRVPIPQWIDEVGYEAAVNFMLVASQFQRSSSPQTQR